MGRLDGKVAIIAGGTSGIGRRTAERFAEEGARVVIAGRRTEEGERLAKSLGPRTSFIRTDVTREPEVQAMIAHAVAHFGRLDCLFNNAGGGTGGAGSIESVRLEEYEATMAVLLRAVFLGIKHAAPVMRRQSAGSIISTGSVAGLRAGYSSSMIYSAAKAGMIHLSRCAAMELGEQGIRVNTITPGGIATGIFGKAMGLPTEEAERTAEKVKIAFAQLQPIQRAGVPDDIAHAAVFLASDESTFINGHDLVVDGGLSGGRLWSAQQDSWKQMREFFRTG
jgi:NAD(P)-dependent dehydrogenase (short-subunit alcohol dehydrogenase family)